VGNGFESIVVFQVQIKGHNQRENEDKWHGCQYWTDEKLETDEGSPATDLVTASQVVA